MKPIAILEKGYETYRYRFGNDDETIIRTGDGKILVGHDNGMCRCLLSDDIVECDRVTYMDESIIEYYMSRPEGQDEFTEDEYRAVSKKIRDYLNRMYYGFEIINNNAVAYEMRYTQPRCKDDVRLTALDYIVKHGGKGYVNYLLAGE